MPGVDEAEPARPRAAFAEHHERRRSVGPALRQVGAAGVLAHRDEAELADGLLERQRLGPERDLRSQPFGLAGADRQPVGDAGMPRAGRAARLPRRGQAPSVAGHQGPRHGRTRRGHGRRRHGARRRPAVRARRRPTVRRRAVRSRRPRRPSARRCPPRRATSPAGRRCRTARCARAGRSCRS